jgi:hypothetical protein
LQLRCAFVASAGRVLKYGLQISVLNGSCAGAEARRTVFCCFQQRLQCPFAFSSVI